MKFIKNNIPNAITLLSLLFGCIGIVLIFSNRLQAASWMIIFAAIADFMDGMAARLLNAKTSMGKELDSLADIVSFGVAPGMMLISLIGNPPYQWIGFLIPLFAALRLAKFNLDSGQSAFFTGLPTPANALFIASFPLIIDDSGLCYTIYHSNIIITTWFFVCVAILCAFMMVAPVKILSMKMKDLTWANNRLRYILSGISLASVLLLGFAAIPLILLYYVLISLIGKNSKEFEDCHSDRVNPGEEPIPQ